jgi:hypothetical protein
MIQTKIGKFDAKITNKGAINVEFPCFMCSVRNGDGK